MEKLPETKWDDISKVETESQTHLEEDTGWGDKALIRAFEFTANPEAFKQHTPSRQELFNYHSKQIEIALWADGFKVMPDVEPKVSINKKGTKYRIIVGAQPMKGHHVHTPVQTLTEVLHGKN